MVACMTYGQYLFERIADLIFEKYWDRPDSPWQDFPDYEVFRHRNNRKWYGLGMSIQPSKAHYFGISGLLGIKLLKNNSSLAVV